MTQFAFGAIAYMDKSSISPSQLKLEVETKLFFVNIFRLHNTFSARVIRNRFQLDNRKLINF